MQVKHSKEADGWHQLHASNRHAAEQSVTAGLLEAPFMRDAAAALAALEHALNAAGLLHGNHAGNAHLQITPICG